MLLLFEQPQALSFFWCLCMTGWHCGFTSWGNSAHPNGGNNACQHRSSGVPNRGNSVCLSWGNRVQQSGMGSGRSLKEGGGFFFIFFHIVTQRRFLWCKKPLCLRSSGTFMSKGRISGLTDQLILIDGRSY